MKNSDQQTEPTEVAILVMDHANEENNWKPWDRNLVEGVCEDQGLIEPKDVANVLDLLVQCDRFVGKANFILITESR